MTTQSRFKEGLYTPGGAEIPAAEIKRDDQEIRADFDAITSRRREVSARGAAIETEIASILEALGLWTAEGCDHKEYTDQLADLRAEREAMEAGVKYLSGKLELMLRLNTWLK